MHWKYCKECQQTDKRANKIIKFFNIYIYLFLSFPHTKKTSKIRLLLHPVRILSSLSTLFRPLSIWWSTLFRDFSMQSTLLRDLSTWSKDTILNFSSLSAALLLLLLLLLLLFDWLLSFSDLSVLCRGFSLLSVLFLDGTSKTSVLFLEGSNWWSVLFLELIILCDGDLSTVATNFLRCLIYSGYNSKSQWFPPLIHNGSYFSLHSSHSCFPCEKSTTSSAVPYTKHKITLKPYGTYVPDTKHKKERRLLTWIMSTGQLTRGILSMFCIITKQDKKTEF